MTRKNVVRAVVRGTLVSALATSMMATTALAEPPVDLSKWSPEYVRSIAGTETFDTAEACGKVTPLDYKGRLTFWYQGVFEGDPDLLRQYYADFFETFRKTYPNIQLEEQALTYNDLLDKFRTALAGNAGPMAVRLQILGGVEFASKGVLAEGVELAFSRSRPSRATSDGDGPGGSDDSEPLDPLAPGLAACAMTPAGHRGLPFPVETHDLLVGASRRRLERRQTFGSLGELALRLLAPAQGSERATELEPQRRAQRRGIAGLVARRLSLLDESELALQDVERFPRPLESEQSGGSDPLQLDAARVLLAERLETTAGGSSRMILGPFEAEQLRQPFLSQPA